MADALFMTLVMFDHAPRVWRYSLFLALLGIARDINAASFEAAGNCCVNRSEKVQSRIM